jgi:hypothetical protein
MQYLLGFDGFEWDDIQQSLKHWFLPFQSLDTASGALQACLLQQSDHPWWLLFKTQKSGSLIINLPFKKNYGDLLCIGILILFEIKEIENKNWKDE